ncbi:MAG: hypothetical protein PUB64_04800 [Firmicutes bacterium]|nr:hypothetical protein [Bacillota bacterium]MDY2907219.1 hypothetical protein [Eubacteriales bacterium]
MQMRKAINLIIVLLVILIALLTAIIIISSRIGSGGNDPADSGSREPPVESKDNPGGTAKPPAQTTDTPPTGTGTPPAGTGTPPAGTGTKEPDTTAPSGGTVPDGFRLKKSFSSGTGTPLNIRADVRGEKDAATGKVKVTVLLYLDYRSLYLGGRKNCRLSLGDVSEVFTVPGIHEDSAEEHSQFIASVERLCDYGEKLSLYAKVPFRGSYSDIEIDALEIDTDITVK